MGHLPLGLRLRGICRGIRPVLDGEGGDVRYELNHCAFKAIALRAAAEGLKLKREDVFR